MTPDKFRRCKFRRRCAFCRRWETSKRLMCLRPACIVMGYGTYRAPKAYIHLACFAALERAGQ